MGKAIRKTTRKIISLFATMLVAATVCFGLMFLVPGDAAEQIALARYGVASANRAEVEEIRRREGLDEPLYEQFGRWISRAARGDFGRSLITGKAVSEEIVSRLPATLILASSAALCAIFLAFPLSIWAAMKPSNWRRLLVAGVSLGGAALPTFWLAYLLLLVFALGFRMLPIAGYGTFSQMVLPTLSLGIGGGAFLLQLLSRELEATMTKDYIRTSRALGISESRLVAKYALKNAVLPSIAFLGVFFVQLLEGAVVVETIFAVPGVGRLLVNAVYDRDLPVIQGCVLVLALLAASVASLTDAAVAYADPRVRFCQGNDVDQ